MAVNEELLDMLACPKCKGDVKPDDSESGLVCDNCKLIYEVVEGVPVLVIDEAKPIKSGSR